MAIRRAHCDGVLTSASLMVNEPSAAEAVTIARQHPQLDVGLHITLSGGRAALPPHHIPHLVDECQNFRASPTMAGILYFFSRRARKEVVREVEEQFDRFAETGLSLSHVNAHQHLHLHPVVWDVVVDQCEKYGVRWIRIPYEEYRPVTRNPPTTRRLEWLVFRVLRRRCLRSLRQHNILAADRVYGHLGTGCMHLDYLWDLLGRLGGRINEIYLHPGSKYTQSMPNDPHGTDVELNALLHPALKERITELGLILTNYRQSNSA